MAAAEGWADRDGGLRDAAGSRTLLQPQQEGFAELQLLDSGDPTGRLGASSSPQGHMEAYPWGIRQPPLWSPALGWPHGALQCCRHMDLMLQIGGNEAQGTGRGRAGPAMTKQGWAELGVGLGSSQACYHSSEEDPGVQSPSHTCSNH